MIYFRLISASVVLAINFKNSHTLHFTRFYIITNIKLLIFTKVLISKTKIYLLLMTVAKFTVKTTNSEFDIYFLSLMSCSINKQ